MTAEIAILNRHAIALAADSKVTIGGARMAKTYDTVNKLFTLSKIHPVGVMIYGNADFMKFPWETIIKLYRKNKAKNSEPTISDWSKDFCNYVKKFHDFSVEDRKENLIDVCRSNFSSIMDETDDAAIYRDIDIHSEDYKDVLKDVFMQKMHKLSEKDSWLTESQSKSFIKTYGALVDKIRDSFFSQFEDEEIIKLADQFISMTIFSKTPSPMSSGIVIAGFGEDEVFPAFVCLECDGVIGGKVKIYEETNFSISRQQSGCVRAFAQGEMVQRFMNGVDPTLASTILTAFAEVLSQNCLEVLETYAPKRAKSAMARQTVDEAVSKAIEELASNISNYTHHAYAHPIVEMISLLPKDELAILAESLVGLTSLKRRVSSDLETVGGAIDVALISKGDGFVWIKRKYYFPPELNPHFTRDYFSHIDEGIENA